MPNLISRTMRVAGAVAFCAFLLSGASAQAQTVEPGNTRHVAEQRRPRIVIRPGHQYLSPNAKRYCTFWLQKEDRPSGPVITPQQRCWWED